jgi:hypothetical protein
MKATALYIAPDGTVSAVADETAQDIAATLGDPVKTRASHVLPVHPGKQFAFVLLRSMFGDAGRIAAWCRSWRGPWQVFWKGDRKPSFQHPSRRVCIQWEIDQLQRRLANQ